MSCGIETTSSSTRTPEKSGRRSLRSKNGAERIHLSFQEYRNHAGISQSDVKLAVENPILFERRRILRVTPQSPPTPQMQWGIDCESAIRSHGPPSGIQMIPRSALNEQGHRRGKNWTDFVASVPSGVTLLSEDEYELLYGKWGCYTQVVKNIESHHAANILLFSARKREWNVQVLWTCPRTGLDRKAEIDVVLPTMKIIIDVKTAQDPTPKGFPWAVRKFGYDIQAATYLEAITSLTGKEGWRFAFVVIRNSAPYDCFVYEDTPEWLAEAHAIANDSLDYFMALKTSGNWFPTGWGQSIKLEPQYRGAFNAF